MSIAKRSLLAARWNAFGNLLRVTMQFAVGIVLARSIGPHEFGLVAVAIILVGFGQMFVDFGFNAAIVQTKDLAADDIDVLGTLQLIIGGLMTVAMASGAMVIASIFGQPTAAPIIAGMAWMFLLRSFGQNAIALLNRDLRFREVQLGGTVGYVVGYIVVGIPLALSGCGAWSIVCAQLVQSGLTSAIAIWQVGHVARIKLKRPPASMLRFGQLVLSANLGSWALANVDALIVGRIAGATDLAFYNRSMTLANAPVQALLSSLQTVLFAATARAQDNPDGCRRALFTCFASMSLVTCPILFAVATVPNTVLMAMYGPAWIGAAPLLTPLCVTAVVNGIVGFLGPVLMGVGRIERETRAQWTAVLIMLPILLIAGSHSTLALAWAVAALSIIRFGLLTHAMNGILQLKLKEIVSSLLPGLLIGVFAALGANGCDDFYRLSSPLSQLFAAMAGALLGAVIGAVFAHRLIAKGPVGEVLLSMEVVPLPIRLWVGSARTIRAGRNVGLREK